MANLVRGNGNFPDPFSIWFNNKFYHDQSNILITGENRVLIFNALESGGHFMAGINRNFE